MKRRVQVGLPLYVLGMHATLHWANPAVVNDYRGVHGLLLGVRDSDLACLRMSLRCTQSVTEGSLFVIIIIIIIIVIIIVILVIVVASIVKTTGMDRQY
jgi:hypothetical protein